VCVFRPFPRNRVSKTAKKQNRKTAACVQPNTRLLLLLLVAVAVVVVVVGSKMGSNYYEKVGQIPVWDLTTGWYNE